MKLVLTALTLAVGALSATPFRACAAGVAMPPGDRAMAPACTFWLGNDDFRVQITARPPQLMQDFGPRFDNTAMVNQVWRGGRSYLSPHGLIDEFGIDGDGVLGFEQAPYGGNFLKIGVGKLARNYRTEYQFWNNFEVRRLMPIGVTQRGNTVTLSQRGALGGRRQGRPQYGYYYTKTYRVLPASDELVIDYTLQNTGRMPYSFTQYNHNWFAFSERPAGPEYALATAFPINQREAGGKPKTWLRIGGTAQRQQLSIIKPITEGVVFSSHQTTPASANRVLLSHSQNGQKVQISGDFAVNRFTLFTQPNAVCPEVFARFTVPPGQSQHWQRRYHFMG